MRRKGTGGRADGTLRPSLNVELALEAQLWRSVAPLVPEASRIISDGKLMK